MKWKQDVHTTSALPTMGIHQSTSCPRCGKTSGTFVVVRMKSGIVDLEAKAALTLIVRSGKIMSAAIARHTQQFIRQAVTASSNPSATRKVQKHAAYLASVAAKKATRSANATTTHEPAALV